MAYRIGSACFSLCLLALLPAFAVAMQPLEEARLSDVTGQDGVTVKVMASTISWNQTIYDRDGVPDDGSGNAKVLGISTSLTPGAAGVLVMKDLSLTLGGPLTWTTDVGQGAGNQPVLNITFNTTGVSTFHVGDLQLGIPATVGGWALDDSKTKTIASAGVGGAGMDINIGATTMNMQLGNVPQKLVILNGGTYNPLLLTDLTIQGGVHVTNMTVPDVSSAYTPSVCTGSKPCAQTIGDLYINNNDGTLAATTTSNFTLKGLGINVTDDGLAITADQIGYRDGSNVDHGINVQLMNVHLGDSTVPGLGNAYLKGMTLAPDSVLTIAGH